MKTSIDIDDALLERARRRARRDQVTIKQIIESGLRLALRETKPDLAHKTFEWPVAIASAAHPLNAMTVNEAIDAVREEAFEQWIPQAAPKLPTPKRRQPK
jgi:hypothetical protein